MSDAFMERIMSMDINGVNELALKIAFEALKYDNKRVMIYVHGDDLNISIFTDVEEETDEQE